MGRLVIAHHKSYHPYRRDNIEKVRRDEEEARQKEAHEEGRMMLADSEARIDLLRERAGGRRSNKKDDTVDLLSAGGSQPQTTLPTTKGHINFFGDLEHPIIANAVRAPKKAEMAETDKGFPLAPSAKDLKPWYSEGTSLSEQDQEVEDERRKRDAARKSVHDPLTSITHQLASRASTSGSSNHNHRPSIRSTQSSSAGPSEIDARLTRESSERQRALDLIRCKKRELEGSETPSTVHGDRDGYGDVFNRKEVEEAHRGREKKWDKLDRGRGDPRRRW